MQHHAKAQNAHAGDLLQQSNTAPTEPQKRPENSGRAGLVWTALGLVIVTGNARAEQINAEQMRPEQMRTDNSKIPDLQSHVVISPINELVGARIYILDDDGTIMTFDPDQLGQQDIAWGIDDDGHIFFLTDPTGKALVPQLEVPHQIVALHADSDMPIYALPHFLQHGDEVIISPLTDFLAREIAEKGLTDLEAGDFIATYLALDGISNDFESLDTAIREEIITRIEDTRLLAEQQDEKIYTMQQAKEYAYAGDDDDITLPPAEFLLAVTADKDDGPHSRGNVRQQGEEQLAEEGLTHLDELTVTLLEDQGSTAGGAQQDTPLPEDIQIKEDLIEPVILADVDVPTDNDVYTSVSATPDII